MATRRPKVPRATPAAPKSQDKGDGGDVIQADFGGRTAPGYAAAPASGSRHDSPQQDAGRAAPGKAAADRQLSSARTSTATSSDTKATGTKATGTKATGTKTNGTKASGAGKPPAEPDEAPIPAKAFSGRMLALSVVMIAITIMLAPTVKIFFEKRAEIAALQADISAKQSERNDLRRQVSRWQDPNYVKQQARDRINMVMPGETGYWVFGSDLPAGESGSAAGAATFQDPAKLPWVDTLWDSIRRSATD
ncbi:cell division protein FtsB [Arthrobacter sp. V4I6]|uniref:FtsB family cell division protein n=1 Tax=unclassified Arthrobacter TaxID=235627 RepID=UPI002783251A|nr:MULTISPECIES: septum formation initiator family protein [unclassified Arthrobacter]MDQ0822182.1 cell division protein FtsB [Arthrobacter sp. V1I7]MDQ0856450.1 cell division protein FtsB [Arthrobacter sp. V4I6]